MYVLTHGEGQVVGTAEVIRETLETLLEEKLGFFVMLQEDTEDGFVIYLHSENEEDLELDCLEKLKQLGFNDCDCTEVLKKELDVSISPVIEQVQ